MAQKNDENEEAEATPDEVRIVSVSPSEVAAGQSSKITIKFTCQLLSQNRGVIGMGFNGVDVNKTLASPGGLDAEKVASGTYGLKAEQIRIAGVKKISRHFYKTSDGSGSVADDSLKRIDRDRYIMSDSKIKISRPAPEDGKSKIVNNSSGESGTCSGDII